MNEFDWVEDQIEYTDEMVDKIYRELDYMNMNLYRYRRSIVNTGIRIKKLKKDEEEKENPRTHIIKLYENRIEVNDGYLVILNTLYETEMSVITLVC